MMLDKYALGMYNCFHFFSLDRGNVIVLVILKFGYCFLLKVLFCLGKGLVELQGNDSGFVYVSD